MVSIAPYIGYFASVLLMIGLLVSTDVKFRWFNGLGCLVFIFYALLIDALPVLITNAVLLAINAYYLVKIYNRKEAFDACFFTIEEPVVQSLFAHYRQDIDRYFPGVNLASLQGNFNLLVLRDMAVANVFSAKIDAEGNAEVHLNYTIEKYRDYKVGKYLFDDEKSPLKAAGANNVSYFKMPQKVHIPFLKRNKFLLTTESKGTTYSRKV